MIRRTLYAVLLAVFLLVGVAVWYLFRPEKAFINDVVDEPFPGEVCGWPASCHGERRWDLSIFRLAPPPR